MAMAIQHQGRLLSQPPAVEQSQITCLARHGRSFPTASRDGFSGEPGRRGQPRSQRAGPTAVALWLFVLCPREGVASPSVVFGYDSETDCGVGVERLLGKSAVALRRLLDLLDPFVFDDGNKDRCARLQLLGGFP